MQKIRVIDALQHRGIYVSKELDLLKSQKSPIRIKRTTFPYCGASLKIAPRQKAAKCEYCDSSVLITDTESFPNTSVSEETDRGNPKIPMPGDFNATRESNSERHSLFPRQGSVAKILNT